ERLGEAILRDALTATLALERREHAAQVARAEREPEDAAEEGAPPLPMLDERVDLRLDALDERALARVERVEEGRDAPLRLGDVELASVRRARDAGVEVAADRPRHEQHDEAEERVASDRVLRVHARVERGAQEREDAGRDVQRHPALERAEREAD